MRSRLRLVAVLVTLLTVAAGCSKGALPGRGNTSSRGSTQSNAPLVTGTCWTGDLLGADPQVVLTISREYAVPYPAAATALATRPTFARSQDCGSDHTVEVYKVVRIPALEKQLTDYATVLRTQTPLFGQVVRAIERSCMTDVLARAAARTHLRDAVMAPALPEGAAVGWSPASPEQWTKGQRVFACTLTWSKPTQLRYASVFTKKFPTGKRTCIDSTSLVFVDCARRHDRERISVIEARAAVAAHQFPGARAIRKGPHGPYVDVPEPRYAVLDAACTAYLRSVSTTKKLTGVANIDADEWPASGGSYPIYCEADTSTDKPSLVTQGTVYNRG
jgi:hypothetical protein